MCSLEKCMVLLFFISNCAEHDKGKTNIQGDHNDSSSQRDDSTTTKLPDALFGNEKTPDIDWVRISKGGFTFGSAVDTPCRSPNSETQVNVVLTRSFWVAATEITQAQWESMSLPNPSWTKGDKKPATLINFFEAALWCNKLSRLEGLDTCYNLTQCKNPVGTGCEIDETRTGHACGKVEIVFHCEGNIHKYADRYSCPGYRLPTTAEWEYAAKGGVSETHTYGGDLFNEPLGACNNQMSLNDIAWYCFNSNEEVQNVAQKLPNPWGLYDTLGNVNEIVDYFFYGQPLNEGISDENLVDPVGPQTGSFDYGQHRSGNFSSTGCIVKPSEQLSREITQRAYHTGFRPVRTIFE